jgi:hypothetical protein
MGNHGYTADWVIVNYYWLNLMTSFQVPRNGKYNVEIKGYPDAKVTSTKISQYLQIVEIICEGVNEIFVNVLNLLDTLNICKMTINSAFTLHFYVLY